MEKTLDNLHVMLCNELDELSREGIRKHDDLDVVKDLLESIDHIYSIINYREMNNGMMNGEGEMRGSSYRNGNSYQNSYRNSYRNSYENSYGNSYRSGSYGMDGNSSYMRGNSNGYDPYYQERSYVITPRMERGYSGASKEEMLEELKKMVAEAPSIEVKQAISDCIAKME